MSASDWHPVRMVSTSWKFEIKPVTKREEVLFSPLGVNVCERMCVLEVGSRGSSLSSAFYVVVFLLSSDSSDLSAQVY